MLPSPSAKPWLPLFVLLLWLAFVGAAVWQHAQRATQPPIHDASTYFLKAHNFWANVHSEKRVNPLDIEPTFRPPGTVLMSYPFGFDTDYRGFFFRSVYLPIVLLAAGVLIAGYGRDLSVASVWYLVLVACFLSTLPFFYYFQASPDFRLISYWGLVDNFLGGMAALAVAAAVRSVAKQSFSWFVIAAALSSFCVWIKPTGVLVAALTGIIWFALALIRSRSAGQSAAEKQRVVRRLMLGAGTFALFGAAVLAMSLASRYLSPGNLRHGELAVTIMRNELPVSWDALRRSVHMGLGYVFAAWMLMSIVLVGNRLWRMPTGTLPWTQPLLAGLGVAACVTFAFGVWFWIFGAGAIYQIRYGVPFILMALILAIPPMVRLIPTLPRWGYAVLAVPMALWVGNMGLLLVQSDPSPQWQLSSGVNLTSGPREGVAQQALDFAELVKREGRNVVVYSMPTGATDAEFQAVIDYSRVVHPAMPEVSFRRPVDWARPSAHRVDEMLRADYWLFEPVRDRRTAEALLALESIDSFRQEVAVLQAWATQLTSGDGVEVVSETRTRLLRITDSKRLESKLNALIESRRWREAFASANPTRRTNGESLAATSPVLESVVFGDKIELRSLVLGRNGDETTVRIWWKPLRGLSERDWIFFIHSIDDRGNIVLNNQIPLDLREESLKGDQFHVNTISFVNAPREASTRLAVGFYRPNGSMLAASRGLRDWNGTRVIVPAP